MNCDRDMCFHNIWNDIPCEECPCYEKEGEKDNDNWYERRSVMIKLVCDFCGKTVDRRDVCDEDGHATENAMIRIEIDGYYCRGYGDEHLICVGCYNKIENFIEQSVKKEIRNE